MQLIHIILYEIVVYCGKTKYINHLLRPLYKIDMNLEIDMWSPYLFYLLLKAEHRS